ncbi:MAG: geranylgeranylglycerol-phosphate geranylgeranyltransferase [Rhodothermales bacterium]
MVQLIRPLNLILVLCGVVLGAWLTRMDQPVDWIGTLLAALALASVAAAGNVHNDLRDLEADRVNRPDRPLPSGRVSLRTARLMGGVLLGASFVLGAMVSLRHLGALVGIALLLWLYNRWLKHRPLIGNLVVAGLVTLSLPFARLDTPLGPALWVAMVFAFVLNLIRELVKDAEDADGDSGVGSRTLAVLVGTRRVRSGVQVLLAGTLIALPAPAVLPAFAGTWLLTCIPAAVFLALALAGTVGEGFPAPRASRHVKMAMVFGLLALTVSVR